MNPFETAYAKMLLNEHIDEDLLDSIANYLAENGFERGKEPNAEYDNHMTFVKQSGPISICISILDGDPQKNYIPCGFSIFYDNKRLYRDFSEDLSVFQIIQFLKEKTKKIKEEIENLGF